MKRNHHLKDLIENIKRTEEMILLHKSSGTSSLMSGQYEAIKAKQISELIDCLAMPPYQTLESISLIKQILDKYYPYMPEGIVKQKDLRELEEVI